MYKLCQVVNCVQDLWSQYLKAENNEQYKARSKVVDLTNWDVLHLRYMNTSNWSSGSKRKMVVCCHIWFVLTCKIDMPLIHVFG